MGRSFFKPGSASTIEDYAKTPEYYHALSDSHYAMTIRSGQYFQRRWQLDAAGKEINVEELKIDYVMGSGNHARSYLHRTECGMLIELPLGWYPDKGGEWGMVPGSDTEHPQTRRFVSYKCMFCHNAYPNIPAPGTSANDAPGTGHDGKFEAVSSVYRLRQSRCFLESAGKLECASCHDPHRIPRGKEAVRHYSSICLQCHTSTHPAGVTAAAADCITCHMPKRRVDDAPHVIVTDHLIQRRAPANALVEFAERPAEEYQERWRLPILPRCPRLRSTICIARWRRWDWETTWRPASRNWFA